MWRSSNTSVRIIRHRASSSPSIPTSNTIDTCHQRHYHCWRSRGIPSGSNASLLVLCPRHLLVESDRQNHDHSHPYDRQEQVRWLSNKRRGGKKKRGTKKGMIKLTKTTSSGSSSSNNIIKVPSSSGATPTVQAQRENDVDLDDKDGNDDGNVDDDDDEPYRGEDLNFQEKYSLPDSKKERELGTVQLKINEQYKLGNYAKGLKMAKALVKPTEKHFGTYHPVTASAYSNLGLLHKLLGDFIESRKHYNTALKIYKQTVGKDHGSYGTMLHNIATLNYSQIHFDQSLKATDRLQLLETALEYLQDAHVIRTNELGSTHPHTIATQSALGTTLSAHVLHQHKLVTTPITNKNQKQKQQKQQQQYVSTQPSTISQQGWDAAEKHLREALRVAIQNPRGEVISERRRPKKQKQTTTTTTTTTTNSGSKITATENGDEDEDDGSSNTKIQTLSGANAGQNLAIFLKTRATTESPPTPALLQEAYHLYYEVLEIRSELLPNKENHPDVYSTKFSLAELLETMGHEDEANKIRQDILDSYDDGLTTTTVTNITPEKNNENNQNDNGDNTAKKDATSADDDNNNNSSVEKEEEEKHNNDIDNDKDEGSHDNNVVMVEKHEAKDNVDNNNIRDDETTTTSTTKTKQTEKQ